SRHLSPHSFPTRRSSDLINGLLQTHQPDDEVSTAFYMCQQNALKGMSGELKEIETFSLPYVSYLLTGVGNLRQWISDNPSVESRSEEHTSELQSRFDLVC